MPNDAATGEAAEDQEEPDDVPDDDDLRRVIIDARTQCESQKEKLKFYRVLEDHKKGLYTNCEDGKEEEYDDNYVPPEYGDAATGEAAEDQEEPDDVPDDDDLRRVIVDARTQCESQKEKLKFDRMLEDHKKGCTPIAKMATQSSVPYWNCCSGRQRMLCLTKDLRSY